MNSESQPIATLHLTLDRARELRLSFRALKRYATATGKDLFRDGSPAISTLDDFRALVWSMARETDPTVTQAQLSAHISTAVVQHVAEAIHSIAVGNGPTNDNREYSN